MNIGAHLSTKDGFAKLPENARALGLRTYQFFSKNQMQWKARPLDKEEAAAHVKAANDAGITDEAIHASYLLNLGSPEEDKYKKSYEAFVDELRRAEQLGVLNLIFHPGAHMGSGEENALKRISEAMNAAIEDTRGSKVRLVVENTAGQGSMVGYSIDHLSYLAGKVTNKDRIGFCIDSCHAYQAGYDLSNQLDSFLSEFDSKVGIKFIKAFHLNDSKYPFNRHLDRHENLGRGTLSHDFYVNLFSDSRLAKVPAFLETPEGEEGYPKDIKFLKSLGIKL
ncbi:MAG: deoxyribonuclease IV [Thermoplasmatales archaeon]|jgi:deoxyribonuclease-4|nr:deoxyribonuclease IV [Candidatus Thermoplasmatota archaeon]MCL6002646.1 deoxyribonuclease IV [Candidatus Thermoplasmatota archaeon]MDA8055925.1 deoxyribonuclease IV [Thermoplasmatales archaeon]